MKKLREIILEILTIIGYKNDKTIFTERFANLCASKALLALMDEMPNDKKNKLITEMKKIETLEERVRCTRNYFTQEDIDLRFNMIGRQMIADWLKHIREDLNGKQINEIEKFLITTLYT